MRTIRILMFWAVWMVFMKAVCDISPDAMVISTSIIMAAEYIEASLGKK